MRHITEFVSGKFTAWIVLALAVIAAGILFATAPASSGTIAPTAGLPSTTQSAQVAELQKTLPNSDAGFALIVFDRSGAPLTEADKTAIAARSAALAPESLSGQLPPAQYSEDGTAALIPMPLAAVADSTAQGERVTSLRATAQADLPDGLNAYLTGPEGFQADVASAFKGADFKLLLVTVIVVAALLLITYRSPWLWLVPLAVIGSADALASVIVKDLAQVFGFTVDASISGILSVLVFGAGTNYALLLIARYREELRKHDKRSTAMSMALRGAGPAILASGSTVTLSLLTLLFASLEGNRALGFACAIGIVTAMIFALIVLPAALVIFGRGLFWPFVPRFGSESPTEHGFWARLGRAVSRRPAVVTIVSVVVLSALAIGTLSISVGLSQVQQFRGNPESAQGQAVIDAAFPAGQSAQTAVIVPTDAVTDALAIATSTPGVSAATPGQSAGSITQLNVTLDAEPGSQQAFDTITTLRQAYADAPNAASAALVGGSDATALDTRVAAAHDQALIIPLILAIVFIVLLVLLRAVVAPVLLILTVVASYFASLGAANLVFTSVFKIPAFDTSVALFSFLFLVALGVDYNIFLVTRAREESLRLGTREGMIHALSATGGVITSAGILLAAVFAVLSVLPIIALTQIGVIVGIGVLLDTLLVRTVLVPALVFLTGDRFWWPSKIGAASAAGSPVAVSPTVGDAPKATRLN
ncbi:MMPL family transporter [Subtercola sp. PAMC28395]|uniref:MMPL family transporter n=1 Tax=Subtercola sp. PAMC28395 TaxID=2846775 RepID=UPI001C0D8EFA|nr:MMPL family transporter [Subtercola sp. PAMC28395]QWT23640.1 MMPL family transporter [Subtercola sp. PAMC28395]